MKNYIKAKLYSKKKGYFGSYYKYIYWQMFQIKHKSEIN